MNTSKLSGNSADITGEQKNRLKELLPEVFTEDKIDWQKLKAVLGEEIELGERYGLSWKGKSDVFRIIQEPTTKTLKPMRDESVNFDETENVFIEGDNLEALKILQKSYYGKVKMIYIDPPYNTGNDFVYNDKFTQKRVDYEQEAGLRDENGQVTRIDGLSKNSRDNGHYHSNWLEMMYPRLYLARNLLRKDGVIFVSIDDNEVHNLRQIMNEIFGEENFRNCVCVRRGIKNVQAQFETVDSLSVGHEYILIYTRDSGHKLPKLSRTSGEEYIGKWDTFWRGTDRPTMRYDLFGNLPEHGQWRWEKNRAQKAISNYEAFLNSGSDDLDAFYHDHYQSTGEKLDFVRLNDQGVVQYYVPPRNYKLISDNWMDMSIKGSFIGFDTEKTIDLLQRMIGWTCNTDDIVMDFFAGSGTLGHAVMNYNARNRERLKWVMVQLPEVIDVSSQHYEAGYKTIADMTLERIRRASKEASQLSSTNISFGFKVFRLASTNFKIWDSSTNNKSKLRQQMIDHLNPIKDDVDEEDLLTELALKSGIDLVAPRKLVETPDGKYYVLDEALAICLEAIVSSSLFESILASKPERVVLLDSSLHNDDQLKTNLLLQAAKASIEILVI